MSTMELALLILGAVLFVASFIIPEMTAGGKDAAISKDEMKKMLDEELKSAQKQMKDTVDETVSSAVEQSDRSLERVSNEKIMALSEYSESVLEEIGKNHKEALFLYDMLHDKEIELKNTIRKAEQIKFDVQEMQSMRSAAAEIVTEDTDLMDDIPETEDMADDFSADNIGKSQNVQILNLHRQGESDVSIARQMGLGVGEVKLVIGLFEGVNG